MNGVGRKLITLKEMCEYLSIGETEARSILRQEHCIFRVRLGNRLYANKTLLDDWIDSISGKDDYVGQGSQRT